MKLGGCLTRSLRDLPLALKSSQRYQHMYRGSFVRALDAAEAVKATAATLVIAALARMWRNILAAWNKILAFWQKQFTK